MQNRPAGYLPAPAGIPFPDPYRDRMKETAFYFEKLRNDGRAPLDSESRAHQGILLPKDGHFPGLRAHNKKRKHHAYWFGPNALGVGFDHNKYDAKYARIRLEGQLAHQRTTLVKTLGWGGNGIACLVRHEHNTDTGPVQEHFVVKCNINNSAAAMEGLRKEKKMQAKYRGALHVTQLMHADIGEGLPPQHPLNNMMFLEYAGRDTLNKLFCSLNDAHMYPPHPPLEAIPNRILWLMFQCLAQACVGMEHRPTKDWEIGHRIDANGLLDGKQPFSERVPPKPKVIPVPPGAILDYTDDDDWDDEGPTKRGTGFVHFDIDPQNVLVCWENVGPESDCHKHFPTLKVSDFGNGTRITARDILGNRAKMSYYRKRAKIRYTAPEQFSEEWDWVEECPIYTDPPLMTAGKFSWKTNLYQFGLVMFTAITLCHPHLPPLHEEMDVVDPDDGFEIIKAWTYGGSLLHEKFNHISLELRTLVARCLCDQPRFRPSLRELQREIAANLNKQIWVGQDSDKALEKWLHDKIDHAPPLRGSRVGKHWVDEPPSPLQYVQPLFPGLPFQPGQQPMFPGVLPGAQPMFPGVPPGQQPIFLGFQQGQQPMLPVVQPAQQPVFPGFQPAVQLGQAPMFPVFQPAVQLGQAPVFPGAQPQGAPAPQPLNPGAQPFVGSLAPLLGVPPVLRQPPAFPGTQPGPKDPLAALLGVPPVLRKPSMFPAPQPAVQPAVQTVDPQMLMLNPGAQARPQGQPAPQPLNPAAKTPPQAPPAPQPLNPGAKPWPQGPQGGSGDAMSIE